MTDPARRLRRLRMRRPTGHPETPERGGREIAATVTHQELQDGFLTAAEVRELERRPE